jgi:hypothetical protein
MQERREEQGQTLEYACARASTAPRSGKMFIPGMSSVRFSSGSSSAFLPAPWYTESTKNCGFFTKSERQCGEENANDIDILRTVHSTKPNVGLPGRRRPLCCTKQTGQKPWRTKSERARTRRTREHEGEVERRREERGRR